MSVYHGKVRDMYTFGDKVIMITTDRISAFDVILPQSIPGKGAVLNNITEYFFNSTKDIAPNWFESRPHPNVMIGKWCQPIMVEMVIRGYLVGHAWREYKKGQRVLCGVSLPEDMNEGDKFPQPIITPTTKALVGHDEDISKEEILEQKLATKEQYEVMERYTRELFQRGSELAQEKKLTLLDTKIEFGLSSKGEVVVIDELLTPDSSRYLNEGKSLSKEFVRDWLRDHDFDGKGNNQPPKMSEEFIYEVAHKYRELSRIMTRSCCKLLEGKRVSDDILSKLSAKLRHLIYIPKLSVIIVGNREDSEMYVKMKIRTCQRLGMKSEIVRLHESISQERLIEMVSELNEDSEGVLVQLPLPKHIDSSAVMEAIDPRKDVDGLHPYNLGKVVLMGERAPLVPCTPKGCLELLDRYGISVKEKHCVIVGASNVVGKPLALLLLSRDATVTVCHVRTRNIKSHTRRADILFVATGKSHLVKKDWLKSGVVVVDIGTSIWVNKNGRQQVLGDVDNIDVMDRVGAITPVPGGVGPMTIAMLMRNTVSVASQSFV